jgi:aldose sugar dehydrogenase
MKALCNQIAALLLSIMMMSAFTVAFAQGGGARPEAPQRMMPAAPQVIDTVEHKIRVVRVADGLSFPYGMTFLPDGGILITELEGRLRLVRDGKLQPEPIGGMPKVYYRPGGAGLMDVVLHPNFAQNRTIYLVYNKQEGAPENATMAISRGTFDGKQVTGLKEIFIADAWATTTGQLSARLAFGRDGLMYMAVSVRGQDRAQKLNDHAGKVLRLRDDGTPAPDNPFAGRADAKPEIFTYGHRNLHGIAVHPETGAIWTDEHGDEVNILKAGGNYGWPFLSIAGQGGGNPSALVPQGAKLEPPYIGFMPALNVGGMTFYTGDKFPNWKNNLFLAGLDTQQIHRVSFNKNLPWVRENVFTQIGQRVRDVREGRDGFLYFITDEPNGHLMRIEPAQ